MPKPKGRRGHVVIVRATDPDCLTGKRWGSDRLKAATRAFNEALGLDEPQYMLTYENGMVQAVVDDDEEHLTRSYQVGISSGLERAAKLLLAEATKEFERGCDKEAKRLRRLSERLKELGKKEHPGVPS